MTDSYKTLSKPTGESLFRDRGSKFIGLGFPVHNRSEVGSLLDKVREDYPKATHHCYAYRITSPEEEKAEDDGEPSNSAGKPILGQIESAGLYDVLIIVIRYYGGTKLGVGGLITAYREAAARAIAQGKVITKHITENIEISYGYDQTSSVMQYVHKHGLEIVDQSFQAKCKLTVAVPQSGVDSHLQSMKSLYPATAKHKNDQGTSH